MPGTTQTVLPVLVAMLALAGCAHQPELSDGQTASTVASAGSSGVERTRPATAPDTDPRYDLPPAKGRSLTIFIGSQTFEYVEDERVVASGPVSTGSAQHPTPLGRFHVLSKDKDKRSGKYTNYFDQNTPMPYSLQFYGPYFIHEGWLPGYADSHGCVRLRYEDARLLFHRIKVGDPVLVRQDGGARLANSWRDVFPVF